MKLLDFNVRLNVYVLNLRRLLSIVIRCASLFGVGGSGRSPVSTFWMNPLISTSGASLISLRPNTGVATLLLLFITFPARQPFRASNHVPKVILDLSGSHFGAVVSGAIVCGYYGEWCYGEFCYGEWVL